MARGHIFYVTENPRRDFAFGESDYYDKLDILNVDYVRDMSPEQSQEAVRLLRKRLQGIGAMVGEDVPEGFAFSFRFGDAENAKHLHFAERLEEFKRRAAGLTLDEVVQHAPALDYLLDDGHEDMVCYVESFDDGYVKADITVDDFIRRLKPGDIPYYVYDRVILIH